ncbi:MAG: hypothetical protein PUG41_06390, partial [Prevotellaceae bacterium]|nr:hypothetical protein [Prevotellaceae bacterium]
GIYYGLQLTHVSGSNHAAEEGQPESAVRQHKGSVALQRKLPESVYHYQSQVGQQQCQQQDEGPGGVEP